MIKKLWFVRSTDKLLQSISITLTALSLAYSTANVFVLEQQGRLTLLIIPLISTVCCLAFHLIFKKAHRRSYILTLDRDNQMLAVKNSRNTVSGTEFFVIVILFLLQTEYVNKFKSFTGSYIFMIALVILSLIIFLIFQLKKRLNIQKSKEYNTNGV